MGQGCFELLDIKILQNYTFIASLTIYYENTLADVYRDAQVGKCFLLEGTQSISYI